MAGWAREESSPRGPHSSVPATDSRLEKGLRPRNYLSWKSPSGLLLPLPQLSHNPGDGPPPLVLFPLWWKAASLSYEPARHSPPWTWDCSRPWGRRRQGSGPHYPNPGVVAPPHSQLPSSGLMGGLALCPRLFWKLGVLSLMGEKGSFL